MLGQSPLFPELRDMTGSHGSKQNYPKGDLTSIFFLFLALGYRTVCGSGALNMFDILKQARPSRGRSVRDAHFGADRRNKSPC